MYMLVIYGYQQNLGETMEEQKREEKKRQNAVCLVI